MAPKKHTSPETLTSETATLASRSSGLKGALARPKGRRAKEVSPSPTAAPDPIFAAIAAAREAARGVDDAPPIAFDPVQNAERDERTALSNDAHRTAFGTVPSSPAGLLALIDFAIEQKDVLVRWESGPDALAAIRAGVAALMGSAVAEIDDGGEPFTMEGGATLDFKAMDLDVPVRTATAWHETFSVCATGMTFSDRILRMDKAEVVALCRGLGCDDGSAGEQMFKAIDGARTAFEGWAELLMMAACRSAVAISTVALEWSAGAKG